MRSALPCLSCQGIYGGTNNCEIIYIWHYLHHAMNTIQCTRWRRCAETIEYPFVPRLADNWSDLVFNKIINYQYGVKLIRYYVGKYPNSWDDFAKHEPIPNTYSFRRNARNIRFPILFFFLHRKAGTTASTDSIWKESERAERQVHPSKVAWILNIFHGNLRRMK